MRGALPRVATTRGRRADRLKEVPLFRRVIDLTHGLEAGAPTFGPDEKLVVRVLTDYDRHGYFTRELTLPEHYATHIDAPAHFAPGGWTVDEIPPERLLRPLAVLDISSQALGHPDYLLEPGDIAAWESQNGPVPQGAVVMLRSGWDRRWPSATAFCNRDPRGAMRFPGYSLEAAQFLVRERSAVGLGIDTLSVDAGIATDFPVHRFTSARAVYHLEAVANLDAAPANGAWVAVAPVKLKGGSGGPVRVLALVV